MPTTRLRLPFVLTLTALLIMGLSSPSASSVASASSTRRQADESRARWACPPPTGPLQARCLVRYSAFGGTGQPNTDVTGPAGYAPHDLRHAYLLPRLGGRHHTVGIVDAYDNPRAEADLAVYRARFNLPPCTRANRCLHILNQRGAAHPQAQTDVGWGVEIALDLDMVSATCPHCHILLIEADSQNVADLAHAVDTAVRHGADVVTNSYGLDEYNGVLAFAKHYLHAGVPVLAATGDFGFGAASFPSVLSSVVAVGGTSLTRTSTGWHERAWADGGSACSAYVPKPSWQRDSHCSMRVTADVSAVADPATGPAFYDTFGLGAGRGWMVGGGTSASSPLIAGMIALAGDTTQASTPRFLYRHRGGFQDVVGGSNGFCGNDYLCTALPGYDAPTGLGTPRGLSGL